MEPLSKEEIEECLKDVCKPMNERWQRLFYTACLGAEFVHQTQKVLDTEARQV